LIFGVDGGRQDLETVPSIVGDLVVLEFVHSKLRVSLKCYIVVEHEKHNDVGGVVFSDRVFADKIMGFAEREDWMNHQSNR
jgi:hypothetical protein